MPPTGRDSQIHVSSRDLSTESQTPVPQGLCATSRHIMGMSTSTPPHWAPAAPRKHTHTHTCTWIPSSSYYSQQVETWCFQVLTPHRNHQRTPLHVPSRCIYDLTPDRSFCCICCSPSHSHFLPPLPGTILTGLPASSLASLSPPTIHFYTDSHSDAIEI